MNCAFCNHEILGRHHLAKTCLSCSTHSDDRTGGLAAINAVSKAVRNGILAPVKTLICVDCGSQAQCYDHRDYNKPLEVVPVCRKFNFRRGSAIALNSLQGA
jgi:hypothetical protein